MKLFHVSEDPGITSFKPRSHTSWPDLEPSVWAVDDEHLRNYLLPRDCPRVTFYALPSSSDRDVKVHLGGDRGAKVVAVEEAWAVRIASTTLWLYEFAPGAFTCFDEGAGHYISAHEVRPLRRHHLQGLTDEIAARGATFRTLPELWHLSDAIVPSTLQFSMIRMRNAKPRKKPNEQ